MCYGKVPAAKARSAGTNLPDLSQQVSISGREVQLPFDAAEVVENLRRERYTAHFRQEGRILNDLLRKAYYIVRPILGVSTRRHLQQFRLRGWQAITFPSWPVDSTVERFHRKLLALSLKARGLSEVPFIWFWPDGFQSCAIMTHDVEDLEGRNHCLELLDMDQSVGIRSAFQLVPESRYVVSEDFVKSITSRGFEVNVHDLKHDGRLYAEHEEFLQRAERINRYAREFSAEGFRSGALYRNADWYGVFEFSYDMSIPNVAHLDPQRGGCCTVMPYFIGKIVELPVTCTQDYALFQLLGDYSISLWKSQVDLIRKENGLINFIVHPDYVFEPEALRVYKTLLGYLVELLSDGSVWAPLPREVARWWRERSQMRIVQAGGGWRIEGAGSDRARVAYASLAGDSVRYRLEGSHQSL